MEWEGVTQEKSELFQKKKKKARNEKQLENIRQIKCTY